MRALVFLIATMFAVNAYAGEIYEMTNTLDGGTHYAIFMDVDHHKVHEGEAFYAFYNNDTTNTGEMTCIGLNTPNTTKWAHMVLEVTATSLTTIGIYEAPSIDNGEGTAFVTVNRNRNSTETSLLTSILVTPVANNVTTYNETQAAGANITKTTPVYTKVIGQTGNPATKAGGASRGAVEYILKQNTQYAFCGTAGDANDNNMHIELEWYEHTDKAE